MTKLLQGSFASLALLFATQVVLADDKLPSSDREFLTKAVTCGHAEVKFSELADKQAENPKVKEFAATMVREHTDANKKLAEHARNQKVAVAAGFERDKRDIYDNLARLNGADFDKAYMKQMVEDHENAVKMLENQSKIAQDPELKKYAEEMLPKIQAHLKQAKEIQEAIGK